MTGQPAVSALCPSKDLHQWHPVGYVQHSNWADDALTIATQSRCPGCGGMRIWTPKRPDLQIRGADWTGPDCAYGLDDAPCNEEAICWRNALAAETPLWMPVCADHTGLPRRSR